MSQSTILKGQDGSVAPVDSVGGGSLVTMDVTHYMHHLGLMYSGGASDTALGAGADLDLLIVTPASPRIHATGRIVIEQEGELFLFEGTTVSANGNARPVIDRLRGGPAAATQVFEGPTITDDGAFIGGTFVPGGSGKGAPGGEQAQGEFIFLPSTNYLLRGRNLGTGTSRITLALDWYEPPTP